MIFLLITHPSCETHLRINEFVVFHIQRGFFLPPAPPSLWKGHVTMNTVKVTAEWSPADEMFVDDSGNLLCTRAHSTGRIWPWPILFFFDGHLCLSSGYYYFFFFSCWHWSLLLIFTGSPFVLHSHNTKTTTWLDPRLAKKAKPPEKCEDGGMCVDLATQRLCSSIQPIPLSAACAFT